ncbi:MAG: VOC family protein [Bryobacterales bacterium]|nr:VOC family protein [Bryobacterales bacterium]
MSSRMIFVNLPVRDLTASMEFFRKLGFAFDRKFTNDKAACMILSEDASYVMLLSEPFFQGFTRKQICDASAHTEALLAISCPSREEVNTMVRQAVEAGGKPVLDPTDYGFMYSWSFYDLDGHHWEPLWMAPQD